MDTLNRSAAPWHRHLMAFAIIAMLLPFCLVTSASAQQTSHDIVLYAAETTNKVGAWTVYTDATAAGGSRIRDASSAQSQSTPLENPAHYFEMTFNAHANVPYRLWMRMKADGTSSNYYQNDSVWVQFDHSVNLDGSPVWRIGTTGGTIVQLQDANQRPSPGWGWNDNGTGITIMGYAVLFDTSGQQTIRVQRRDDGVSIDQIVLSPTIDSYFNEPPGDPRNDTTILNENAGASGGGGSSTEIVLWAGEATTYEGTFAPTADATAAGGVRMFEPNAGAAKVNTPFADPANSFEMTFNAQAGVGYRLWLRLKAVSNYWGNDSVWVQFDNSVDVNGTPIFRSGTTNATWVSLEEYANQGESGWGWQDNGYGAPDTPGPLIYFATTGPQTIRVQRREDGVSIDQIVLSASTYFDVTDRPGPQSNDNTILPKNTGGGGGTPPPSLLDGNLDVISWNIHRGVGTDSAKSMKRVASYAGTQNADVICLQELPTSSTDQNELLTHLEGVTATHWSLYYQPGGAGNAEGNAILSRYPVTAMSFDQMSSAQQGRVIIQNTIDFNGTSVNVFSTHLDSGGSANSAARRQQVTEVNAFANPFAAPRIIVGDFNATISSGDMAGMLANYVDGWPLAVTGSDAVAYPPDNPVNNNTWTRATRIDYTWHAPNNTSVVRLERAQVVDTRDHSTYLIPQASQITDSDLLVGNADDRGVRPSDHNMIKGTYSFP